MFISARPPRSFATSMYMLAAFRAFQGLGAGGLFSLALAIIGDIVAPRERARYTGYFMAVFGMSSVLGPVIGGFFASDADPLVTGWRWVFLVNVPIGIVALVVVYGTLHVHHHRREARIDCWGRALVVALVPLLISRSRAALGLGSGGGWSAIVRDRPDRFDLIERRMGDNAMIPLRFFPIRPSPWHR